MNPTPHEALAGLWRLAGLPEAALAAASLPDGGPVLPTSFRIAAAAQASLGAAALAAAEIDHRRTPALPRQHITVAAEPAVAECTARLAIDGRELEVWDKLSGLYPCGSALGRPGWVCVHANFAHHRDGALRLLGLPEGPDTTRDAVTQALARWQAVDFESAAADAGMVVSAARRFEDWDAHAQGRAMAGAPPFTLERLPGNAAPRPWPARRPDAPPLAGLRVLELTRILAGPVAGRTLAGHGAEVLMINGPHLPNIEHIADTSRGKRSALADLRSAEGCATLAALLPQADVFLQGYRPGGLAARGFGPAALAAASPGLVVVTLSAYGPHGPWAARRGFDSLVQTATGFNWAEAEALGSPTPKALPVQILDFAAGYLLAFAAEAALLRQRTQGGSWHVQVSLAAVGLWLRQLGRTVPAAAAPDFERWMEERDSGWGRVRAPAHAAQWSRTPPQWPLPARPPGSDAPAWA